MPLGELLDHLHGEIQDVDEEVFELFSNQKGSTDLGMLNPQARTVDVCISGRDMTLHQSPGVLTSDRAGGTTGAVVWRISVPFAEWLSSEWNILFRHGVLSASTTVLELGAGVGVVGLALSPHVSRYILTDQDYMMKLLRKNIEDNAKPTASSAKVAQARKKVRIGASPTAITSALTGRLQTLTLDWETSNASDLARFIDTRKESGTPISGIDAVVACDCIFNEALVDPFVQTCEGICTLRETRGAPTVCIIAQQLRSPEVFEHWLRCMSRRFRVWRLPTAAHETELPNAALSMANEYSCVAHLAILRGEQDADNGSQA